MGRMMDTTIGIVEGTTARWGERGCVGGGEDGIEVTPATTDRIGDTTVVVTTSKCVLGEAGERAGAKTMTNRTNKTKTEQLGIKWGW